MHSAYEHSNFQEYLEELLAIPSSDILVNCRAENKQIIAISSIPVVPTEVSYTSDWKRLISFSTAIYKSTDTHTLCLAIDTVAIQQEVQTPCWLVPIRFSVNLRTNVLTLQVDLDTAFLNPYLLLQLDNYNIAKRELETVENFDEKRSILQTHFFQQNITYTPIYVVGNFHHHRFQLVKELEEIQQQTLSPLIHSLLGNEVTEPAPLLSLAKGKISSLDKDQSSVFEYIHEDNCIVEGPPGTGKSEVIGNLLAKKLNSPTSQLVVSEKKTALDVLLHKLTKSTLQQYAFEITSETNTKQLIAHLFSTWKMLEESDFAKNQPLYLSEQRKDNLQLLLDKLNATDLVGGISYGQFLTQLAQLNCDEIPYISNAPTFLEWQENKDDIAQVYAQIEAVQLLSYFQKNCFESTVKLDTIIALFQEEVNYFQANFQINTLSSIEHLKYEVIYAQLIENEAVKKYFHIFQKKTENKKFKKLYFSLQKAQKAFQDIENEKTNWKILPSETQLKTWKQTLNEGSWWQKRSVTKQIQSVIHDRRIAIPTLLHNTARYIELKKELTVLEIKLLDLGVQAHTSELESIHTLLHQWENSESTVLQKVASYPTEIRKKLITNNHRINRLTEIIKQHFCISSDESLQDVVQNLRSVYTQLLELSGFFRTFSPAIYTTIQSCQNLETFEKTVYKANLVRIETVFPAILHYSGATLKDKLTEILRLEEEERKAFITQIHASKYKQFQDYHTLLQTVSSKLSPAEKELKARLKKGKSLLIKEFGKSRHRLTIRELLSSDARDWIQLLNPIWLCTPGQLASSFPMQQKLFELVVFDEASQLPFTHALGALQRGTRALVCGDSKQMSPGSYFSKKSEQIDLLHHASFYWKTTSLTHHYRSVHPALIAFSNAYFYGNSLVAYPTAGKQTFPITLNYCERGRFIERQNHEEAKLLATYLEENLKNATKSIGVVAFSQQQLDAIWSHLSIATQEKIQENSKLGTCFFKTLEQVQGEECSELLISIGYAKNEIGKFQLRMGPLNRRNGHRRLNVLFTRAQEKIQLFTSLRSSDFPISDNESIQLLKNYLLRAEKSLPLDKIELPYQLKATSISGNQLQIKSIYETLRDVSELVTFHEVMEKRGWDLYY
jgi:hypothetical protein